MNIINSTLESNYINFVRNALDMLVGAEQQYPVPSSVLVKADIATRNKLDTLEHFGHIKSIEVDVPSVLVPGSTVKEKAYYTERRVPKYVQQ